MASHAGLVYALETRNGFINERGEFVKKIDSALNIEFYQFGFGNSAFQVLNKLGFGGVVSDCLDVRFHVVIPSFDSRLNELENLYREMGYDFRTAMSMAADDFRDYKLNDYSNFKKYQAVLQKKAIKFYKTREVSEVILDSDKKLDLYKVDFSTTFENEKNITTYYSDQGKVYKYSFKLKMPAVEKYFDFSNDEREYFNNWQNEGLLSYLKKLVLDPDVKYDLCLEDDFEILASNFSDFTLEFYFNKINLGLVRLLNEEIRKYYSEREMHITRMFGSYILLQRDEEGLKAVRATPIPIEYCPLMAKLLKEVGGDIASQLLASLNDVDESTPEEMMCNLINEIVIKGGYFDTNRPLNSCEANVIFGASETMSSAFKNNIIDAAVIVSNNLGTIITTNASNTQGAVKRMTGLFYTSPSLELMKIAADSEIITVFPYTAEIDQFEGVLEAIKLGYKNIAVSVASSDNYLHEKLSSLENEEIKIYKFGLCSTGIDKETALIMRDNADVIWSCASKYVKEYIEPDAIAQVGVKIPVHIMTEKGWDIVQNHLSYIDNEADFSNILLTRGDDKPVCLNSDGKIKILTKNKITKCTDCPKPCV